MKFIYRCKTGITQSVQRLGYGLEYWGSIFGRNKQGIFSLRHRVQTCSGVHPVSYPMGTGGSFPGGKVTGA